MIKFGEEKYLDAMARFMASTIAIIESGALGSEKKEIRDSIKDNLRAFHLYSLCVRIESAAEHGVTAIEVIDHVRKEMEAVVTRVCDIYSGNRDGLTKVTEGSYIADVRGE